MLSFIVDSKSDSDSFAQRISMLAGLDETGQTSKNDQDGSPKQLWFMQGTNDAINSKELMSKVNGKDDVCSTQEATVVPQVTQSPEIFLSDDNIINTQESVRMDIDGTQLVVTEVALPKLVVLPAEKKAQVPERSERLKKDTAMTTMEKVEKIALKANLEGNPTNHNSFSVLSAEEIANVTSCMGIRVDDDDFATFDLIKDLERARNDFFIKQNELKTNLKLSQLRMIRNLMNV